MNSTILTSSKSVILSNKSKDSYTIGINTLSYLHDP